MAEDRSAPFIYMVQMDVPAEHEAEFNRVYDEQHLPDLLGVPGVRAARRYLVERTNKDGMARYLALYELDSAAVVDSPAWIEAGERGDWAPRVRPHTTNRSHTIMRRIA